VNQRDDSVIYASLTVIAVLALLFGFFGLSAESFIVIAVLSGIIAYASRFLLRNDATEWLGKVVFYGWMAKLVGSAFRYWVAVVAYGGRADAVTYYRAGANFHVHDWRQFTVPTVTGRGAGTNFTESVTGFVFVPYVPDMLGGFFMFAAIAFVGQMLFYAAFRKALPAVAHKRYAWGIFLLPSMVYWPSSIGKDALITLALGLASWGAATIFAGKWGSGVAAVAGGVSLAAAIRPHIAALFFGAAVVALVVARAPRIRGGQFMRIALIAVMGVGLAIAAVRLSNTFNVNLSSEGFEGFATEVQRRTSQGGSQVTGEPVSSLADVPEAALRVLYRPLLNEASTFQVLLSAIEGTFLLAITILAAPRILMNIWAARRHQFVALALAYTFGFVVAFSSFFNLGIIARQRVQVLPLLLACLVALTMRREDLLDEPPAEPLPTVAVRSPAMASIPPIG